MTFCFRCMAQISENDSICPHCGKKPVAGVPVYHLLPGTILNGRYMVGMALGEGGFGITYLGLDLMLNMKVAIKEYYPTGYVNRSNTVSSEVTCMTEGSRLDFFKKGKERFLNEARTLARFAGERGVVCVRDFFEGNNTAYIVMEYLDGITLKQYLKEHGVMKIDDVLKLLAPIMQTLSLIHNEKLIHRDISPDNIMIVKGEPKLLDFGAARAASSEGAKSLSVMLKPGYAPEEQYRSKGIQGPWTDIYALCATIYKCITGKTPDDANQRLYKDEIKRPSELGVQIDGHTEAVLMKGMSVLQTDRYQSIAELIDGFQGSEPEPVYVQDEVQDDTSESTLAVFADSDETHIITKSKAAEEPELKDDNIQTDENLSNDSEKRKNKRKLLLIVGFIIIDIILIIVLVFLLKKPSESKDDGADNSTNTKTETKTETPLKTGDVIEFGSYEQDNRDNGSEPIEWVVLSIDEDKGQALLLSKYVLECKAFDDDADLVERYPFVHIGIKWEDVDITWETSTLRKWLNDDFYNSAFSSMEKEQILLTKLKNEGSLEYGSDGGNDTEDKVFIPSYSDVKNSNYGFSEGDDEEENVTRQCSISKYAYIKLGATEEDYYEEVESNGALRSWWLRTLGCCNNVTYNALFVNGDGSIFGDGGSLNFYSCGIRPALFVNLEYVSSVPRNTYKKAFEKQQKEEEGEKIIKDYSTVVYKVLDTSFTKEQLEETVNLILERAKEHKLKNINCKIIDDDRIEVSMPKYYGVDVKEYLGKKGDVYFIYAKGPDGKENITADKTSLARPISEIIADGDVIADNSDIIDAKHVMYDDPDSSNKLHLVNISFNKSGKNKFADATTYAFNYDPGSLENTLAIVCDGVVVAAPNVSSVITDGETMINGLGVSEDCWMFVNQIKNVLPLNLSYQVYDTDNTEIYELEDFDYVWNLPPGNDGKLHFGKLTNSSLIINKADEDYEKLKATIESMKEDIKSVFKNAVSKYEFEKIGLPETKKEIQNEILERLQGMFIPKAIVDVKVNYIYQ